MRERTAWILGGLAAVVPLVGLLIWLNLAGGGSATEGKVPLLPAAPTVPSHPRLQVLEETGSWSMETDVSTFTPTNTIDTRLTSQLDARWGLNGHCMFLEETVRWPNGNVSHDFTVKHYNAEINKYHYTLVEDDGYVRGFIGDWQVGGARMEWESVFLPGAPPDVVQRVVETQTAPGKREIHVEIKRAKEMQVTAHTRSERVGEAKSATDTQPATPELARLGKAGVWVESESRTVKGLPQTDRMTGRARWTPGGRALLYEGVVDNEGTGVYFMWIKTFDREMNLYRYIHFHTDGPVDHFEGQWDEATKTITWKSVQPPNAEYIIRETFVSPTHRNWHVEAYNEQGQQYYSSDGESRLKE